MQKDQKISGTFFKALFHKTRSTFVSCFMTSNQMMKMNPLEEDEISEAYLHADIRNQVCEFVGKRESRVFFNISPIFTIHL